MGQAHLYCVRCKGERLFEVPNPRWKTAFKVWLGVSGLSLFLWPIATFDLFCMTPVLAIIPVALGPLHRLASEAPTCNACGGTQSVEVFHNPD